MVSEQGLCTSNCAEHSADHPGTVVNAVVLLSTAVTTALGGLYMTTRSVVITALVAGLIAVLGICVLLRRRPHR